MLIANYRSVVLLISLAALGCSDLVLEGPFEVECHCSIIQLIVHPERYDGKNVRVRGVVVPAEFLSGQLRLYLSENDAKYMIDVNSVWVDMTPYEGLDAKSLQEYYWKYVVIDGVFTKRDQLLLVEEVSSIRLLGALPLDERRLGQGNL